MAKGDFAGSFFEPHTGVGSGEQIPSVAREYSFGAAQESVLRNAQRLGVELPPPHHTQLIQILLSPRGSQMLELFVKNVFQSFQQHVRLPSHQYVPYRGTSIDEFGTANLAAGVDAPVVTFQVPAGHRGVIVGFGHDVDQVAAWNDLTWSIRAQGIRYKEPYIGITDQVATVLNPWRFSVIHVPEGRLIGLYAVNGGLVQYAARGRLIGWYYPIRRYADGYKETLQE
jgi:hypothetical protein